MPRAGVRPGNLVHEPLKPSILCNLGGLRARRPVAAEQVVRILQLEVTVAGARPSCCNFCSTTG